MTALPARVSAAKYAGKLLVVSSYQPAFRCSGPQREAFAVAVAVLKDGVLVPAGLVKFGLVGKDLWQRPRPATRRSSDSFRPRPGAA
jgi:hypothetical protein